MMSCLQDLSQFANRNYLAVIFYQLVLVNFCLTPDQLVDLLTLLFELFVRGLAQMVSKLMTFDCLL